MATGRSLRSVFADSAIFGLGLAAAPIALVVATPVIARELGPAQYGLVDLLTALSTALAVVALAGLDSAVARSYFDYDDPTRRLVVLRTALAGGLGTAIAVAATAIAASIIFVAASERTVATSHVVAAAIAFLFIPLANGQVLARAVFLLGRMRRRYVLAGILNGLLGVAAAVTLVVAGAGPAGYFLGLCVGALASLLFVARVGGLVSLGTAWLDRPELKRMLRYGLPIMPGSLAIWAVFAIDRTLIASMRGIAEAGYYGIASRISAPLVLAVSAFAVAWGPFIIDQTPARRLDLRARALTVAVACTGACFVVLVAFEKQLVELFGGQEFVVSDAQRAVPGIALGWVGWAAATVLSTEFVVVRKTHVIAIATGLTAAANVLLNILLIPPYGFVGAAWATAASFFLLAAIFWAWERRLNPAPYRVGRLALMAVTLAATTAVLVAWIDEDDWALRGAVALVAAAVLGATAATERGASTPKLG
jgi:O-antigen/teichoic acid export membrane protein